MKHHIVRITRRDVILFFALLISCTQYRHMGWNFQWNLWRARETFRFVEEEVITYICAGQLRVTVDDILRFKAGVCGVCACSHDLIYGACAFPPECGLTMSRWGMKVSCLGDSFHNPLICWLLISSVNQLYYKISDILFTNREAETPDRTICFD